MKELIEKLPKNWNEVTLEMYLRVLDVELDNDLEIGDEECNLQVIDNVLIMTAALIREDVKKFRQLETTDILKIYAVMQFLNIEVTPHVLPIETMKKDIDFSYDNLITYSQLTKDKSRILHNLPAIIKTYLNKDVTDEQVLQMNMVDVMTVFFFVNAKLKAYLTTTLESLTTTKRTMWQEIKYQIGQKRKQKRKDKYILHTDGTS